MTSDLQPWKQKRWRESKGDANWIERGHGMTSLEALKGQG